MLSTHNLSDVASVPTARTNLGLGSASTHADTDYLHVASNLSDLASAPTARTNLGISTVGNTGAYNDLTGKPTLGNAAAYNVNVANGLPVLNGSGQYPGFDGQLIANIVPSSIGQPPRVGTVITAHQTSGGIGYGGGIGGSALGWVWYSYSPGNCQTQPSFSSGFSAWTGLPGAWMNISVQTSLPFDQTIWVRYA
jgi:hypothetical protein